MSCWYSCCTCCTIWSALNVIVVSFGMVVCDETDYAGKRDDIQLIDFARWDREKRFHRKWSHSNDMHCISSHPRDIHHNRCMQILFAQMLDILLDDIDVKHGFAPNNRVQLQLDRGSPDSCRTKIGERLFYLSSFTNDSISCSISSRFNDHTS